MKSRPKLLSFLSMAHLVIAAAILVQIAMISQASLSELPAWISGKNALAMLAAVAHAVALYWVGPWTLLTGGVFLLSSLANHYDLVQVGAMDGMNHSVNLSVLLASILVTALQLPLIYPAMLKLILDKKRRWWTTPARSKVGLRAVIRPVTGGELVTRTFDISQGGAFVSLEGAWWSEEPQTGFQSPSPEQRQMHFEKGTHCAVRLALDSLHCLNCHAEIIRQAHPNGQYPGGFAVRFVGLSREERAVLDNYISSRPTPLVGEWN